MTTASISNIFGDLAEWQGMLDRHAELFSEMLPGSSVGFVARNGSGIHAGKHLAGLTGAQGTGEMLAWEVVGSKLGNQASQSIRAFLRNYSGFQDTQVDLLFVAEDAALTAMRGALRGDALSIMKRQLRQGAIMFYVMKTKVQLQDAGYEEFLDSLGLAFLGACR